jgi:anti-sigma B factor antagonist
MQIELEARDQGAVLVNRQSRLDAAAAPTFRQKIADAISQGNVRLVPHIAHVFFMDSTGLGTSVLALKPAREANGDISINAPSLQVQKLLKLTAMERVFRIFMSPNEALQQPGVHSG